MESFLLIAGAVLVYEFAAFLNQLLTARVGAGFGAHVEEIGWGVGPTLFTFRLGTWPVTVRLFRMGAFVRFVGEHEPDTEGDGALVVETPAQQADGKRGPRDGERGLPEGSILAIPWWARLTTIVVGHVCVLLAGIVLLELPVMLDAPALRVTTADRSTVDPSGVPGLRVDDVSATYDSQLALFNETAIAYTGRLVTFASLDGWGGPIAFFVTAGEVGHASFAAWVTMIGVMLLWIAIVNLVPVPGTSGFGALVAVVEGILGKPLSKRATACVGCVGLLVTITFLVRVVWSDVAWIIAQTS